METDYCLLYKSQLWIDPSIETRSLGVPHQKMSLLGPEETENHQTDAHILNCFSQFLEA